VADPNAVAVRVAIVASSRRDALIAGAAGLHWHHLAGDTVALTLVGAAFVKVGVEVVTVATSCAVLTVAVVVTVNAGADGVITGGEQREQREDAEG